MAIGQWQQGGRPYDIPIGLAITFAQFLALAQVFPLSELLSDAPLFYIDSAFHWYQITAAKAFWVDGGLVGYDPWFAAGHLGGVSYNASAKLPAMLSIAFEPWLSSEVVYKLYSFLSALLAPVCVVLAMRWLRADTVATAGAALLGFLLWWISALHWYHTAGMVSFVFASYAALPFIALTWLCLTESLKPARLVALSVFGAAGLFYHPLFPLPIMFCVPMLIALLWSEVRARQVVIVLAMVPTLSLLPNLLWILPTVHYPGWAGASQTPYQKAVDVGIIWNELLGRVGTNVRGSRVNPTLWFLSFWAVLGTPDRRWARLSLAIATSSAGLLVFAALGAALPLVGTLTPNRMSAAAYLLLTIPAGVGLSAIWHAVVRPERVKRIVALGSAALLSLALLFYGRELTSELSTADVPRYGAAPPEVRGVGKYSEWIVGVLREQTSADARVLFEASGGRIHDGAHMAGYLAITSQREFIGGPYVFMHEAGFWDGFVFGRPISSFSPSEFHERLVLYNIGWIVSHSAQSKKFLDRQPELSLLAERGALRIYEVRGPRSYFLEGEGRVPSRGFNRIELSNLRGEAVTLKYHYVTRLRTHPPTTLEPVYIPGDTQPFVRILSPPESLTLLW